MEQWLWAQQQQYRDTYYIGLLVQANAVNVCTAPNDCALDDGWSDCQVPSCNLFATSVSCIHITYYSTVGDLAYLIINGEVSPRGEECGQHCVPPKSM